MRQFHRQLLVVLEQLAGKLGEVSSSYEDVAQRMGGGATSDDVHVALIDLNDDGYFPGDPMLTSDLFVVRLPEGGEAFHAALKAALRKHEDAMGRVAATFEEIATDLGPDSTADDVHQGIIQLKDDGYFEGETTITSDFFQCRLPEDD